jgi:lysophospholipase L1-like esterase
LGVWLKTTLAKNWMMTHSSLDTGIRSWLYVNHANLLLKSLDIPFYNFFTNHAQLAQYKPDYIDVVSYDVGVECLRNIDKAKDNSHPGPQAHQAIADKIFEIVK